MPDREKVIKGLEKLRNDLGYGLPDRSNVVIEYLDSLTDALVLLKEQGTGWISVKDRLPDGQYPVLVYVPPYTDENDEYIGYVGMAYYTSFGEGFWAGTDGNVYGAIGMIHEPTHWMPLPDQPRDRW